MGENKIRIGSGVMAGAITAIVLAATFAAMSTFEALEERRSAAEAMDLGMAVTAVAHAGEIQALGGESQETELARSIDLLSRDHESALHALNAEEAVVAKRLLGETSEWAELLLGAGMSDHMTHEHGELHGLLHTATERSSNDAAAAERGAAVALGAMAAVFALAIWLIMRSRSRAVHDLARAEAQARARQRLEVLLNDLPDILLVVDDGGQISYRSASSSQLLDDGSRSANDLIGLSSSSSQATLRNHLNRDKSDSGSALFQLATASGGDGWFDVRVSNLSDHPLVQGHLITIRDVTNETRLRDELQHQAATDFLTGLPNRRVLDPTIAAASAAMTDQNSAIAMMILDIDGFKTINDTLGHLAGDELLVEAASRLDAATRDEETLLRLGGDEFAVISSNVPNCAAAEAAAGRLLEVLDQPFQIAGRSEHVRTSIGVTTVTDPDRAAFLVAEADMALYEAKRLGGNTVAVFQETLAATTTRRDEIVRALREADYDEEFRMVYQPIVEAHTREITSIEALLRWTSPTLGELGPDEFIPLAEITGEICPLGKWIFGQVCQQRAAWTEAGMDPSISVSLNVSPRQLAEDPFVPCVLETAQRWGVQPGQLIIEVTESAALDHAGRAQAKLEQLRDAGLRISIDDFGSGYSNLGQLLAVPFDIIKIDRSLLLMLSGMREQAGGDPSDPCSIMEAIVSIASILDAPVVCEGVETEDQLTSLCASGITHIQGYLTGRPSMPDAITALLADDTESGNDSGTNRCAFGPARTGKAKQTARASV